MGMTIIKILKNCPECGGRTSKRTAEVYVCENPDCRHIDAEQLFSVLESFGVEAELIKKVQENIVVNSANLNNLGFQIKL